MMPLTQQILNVCLHLIHPLGTRYLYVDCLDVCNGEHTLLCRRDWDIDHVVLILPNGLPLLRRQSDDLERLIVDADVLADGVLRPKEIRGDGRTDHGDTTALCHIVCGDERPVLDLE